ncbi:MAG: leucine-rich repeat domain-containing protein, partial [Kiritimatiellaeota bacterium]|nr:leucine-rich repeat domain-containing protein [Kiritimatiellota bacterium]
MKKLKMMMRAAVAALAFFGAMEARAQLDWHWQGGMPSAAEETGIVTNNAGWGFNVKVTGVIPETLEIGDCAKAPASAGALDLNGAIEGGFIFASTKGYLWTAYSLLFPSGVSGSGTDFRPKADSIVLADTLTAIGDGSFAGNKFTNELDIPSSVRTIGDAAFSGVPFAGNLTIPDTVESVGDGAFEGRNTFFDTVTLNPVTELGFAFNRTGVFNFRHINAVNFNGREMIDDYLFYQVRFPNGIEIQDSVTSIGLRAFQFTYFYGNPLYIPDSVTEIGREAFRTAAALEDISVPSGSNVTIGRSAFSFYEGIFREAPTYEDMPLYPPLHRKVTYRGGYPNVPENPYMSAFYYESPQGGTFDYNADVTSWITRDFLDDWNADRGLTEATGKVMGGLIEDGNATWFGISNYVGSVSWDPEEEWWEKWDPEAFAWEPKPIRVIEQHINLELNGGTLDGDHFVGFTNALWAASDYP